MKTETETRNKVKALAEFLFVEEKEIKISEWQENAFCVDCINAEYLVLTDVQADEIAKETIKETLCFFNADFILKCCGIERKENVVSSLKAMQEKCCEDCNSFLFALIEKSCGFEHFANSAIYIDGRGHFISGYNGKEEMEGDFFIYRIN